MIWEKIYTVNRFYDCPVLGIADFKGTPHIYEAILDTPEDADLSRYYLMHIESDLMDLVMEAWDIWIKWNEALDKKIVKPSNQYPLPEDKIREKELKRLIGDRLTAIPEKSVVMKAEFCKRGKTQSTWEVHWYEDSE